MRRALILAHLAPLAAIFVLDSEWRTELMKVVWIGDWGKRCFWVRTFMLRTVNRHIVVIVLSFHKEAECALVLNSAKAALALWRTFFKHLWRSKLDIIWLECNFVVFTLVYGRLTFKFQDYQILVPPRLLHFLGNIGGPLILLGRHEVIGQVPDTLSLFFPGHHNGTVW